MPCKHNKFHISGDEQFGFVKCEDCGREVPMPVVLENIGITLLNMAHHMDSVMKIKKTIPYDPDMMQCKPDWKQEKNNGKH